jgi:hypothetical protein
MTQEQQGFLNLCENNPSLSRSVDTMDRLEELFPRFRLQIGIPGAVDKIVKIVPRDVGLNPADYGKYGTQWVGDTYSEAFWYCLEEFPQVIDFCIKNNFEIDNSKNTL